MRSPPVDHPRWAVHRLPLEKGPLPRQYTSPRSALLRQTLVPSIF